ncbi:hypothetical protein DY124_06175 [Apilactobacillus micheneri]|uniref:hypothetical protein n=1 Tax=Apilactobacillus micheneri TaxID=1899430 RepID=UPI00112AD8D6|nr:hypothetical protein [Apilactobacillus micheneri]TPR43161.1 hypothetical protein DY124_06175 [Apilactobacillus micheneri]TPR47249.1 hypothetical protein DY125_06670 [Apilactobacillus micheneri]
MKNYSDSKNILIKPEDAFAKSIVADGSNISVDTDGNKYLLAGQLMGANKDIALNDDAIAQPVSDPKQAQGILRNDYNFKDGKQYISIITNGYINIAQMSDNVKPFYTADVVEALKAQLPGVHFVNNATK